MHFAVRLAFALLIIGDHLCNSEELPNEKISTLNSSHHGAKSKQSQTKGTSNSGLKSIICGFEVDECGFVDVTTDFISLWRRVCDNGCSMISDATASMSGKTMSNLVSPWFFGNSGVLKMQYYIPDKQTAKFASISVYIRYDETASNNNRELIYLASSEMDRPWVPMAAEMDRPWVPMSVNVKMDDSTHFRFEIEGLLEGSSENIFIDNFEFKPKD